MNWKKGMLITLITAAVVALSSILFIRMLDTELFRQLGPLKVTVENKSEHDIVSVTFGFHKETTPETNTARGIASGETRSIKPKLTPNGENGIYMKWTDERGETRSTVVCGYTESISGYATVIISNDDAKVEQSCF